MGTIKDALLTPSYLLALLQELLHVLRVLAEIAKAKQVRKTNRSGILYQITKKYSQMNLHVSNHFVLELVFEGIRSTLEEFERIEQK